MLSKTVITSYSKFGLRNGLLLWKEDSEIFDLVGFDFATPIHPFFDPLNRRPVRNFINVTVVEIASQLSGNRLRGSIPPSLVHLQFLSYLDLSGNYLSGNLPPFQMESLKYMNLRGNKLHGPVPKSFLNLTSLQTLDLRNNCFDREIPREFGALQSLSHLDVSDNQLSGHIPPKLGNLAQLQYL
ncbi:hypothetical protein CQW23_04320 [Capsicum baccatum]|uniref:LRR receptor-like serine/threonine-protein kinase n=1 Tax=Capsicum baccatum TaxID=33114 RepID=A0A2G2XEC1_CAPBA|nr:hypothetical protein CQW23_04320 [Capsicum baccatum]